MRDRGGGGAGQVQHCGCKAGRPLVDLLPSTAKGPLPACRRRFAGISGHQDLYRSAVIHQALIDVNPKRSEAAATGGVVGASRVEILPSFPADRTGCPVRMNLRSCDAPLGSHAV